MAIFVSVLLITCFLALPVSAEKYEYKNGFSIDVPSTYINQSNLYKSKYSQVLDNNAWVMQDGKNQCVLMTQISKNTDNVKIKVASHSQVLEFENLCKKMISTSEYEMDMNTKKEKINGYYALYMYMNEIKDSKGNVLYGDMYIYSSRKYIYYVYFVYSDKNYSTTSEFNNILNSFEIKDKMALLGGDNLIIYIGVIIVASILLLVIFATKKKQRTVYFNDPGNYNSFQQNINQYGNNSYQQNGYTQSTIDQYGNNTYQQPNNYNQQSSYSQGNLNNNYNNSINGYSTSSQQDTSEWLSSPTKPVDENDSNKLADEFWNNK